MTTIEPSAALMSCKKCDHVGRVLENEGHRQYTGFRLIERNTKVDIWLEYLSIIPAAIVVFIVVLEYRHSEVYMSLVARILTADVGSPAERLRHRIKQRHKTLV